MNEPAPPRERRPAHPFSATHSAEGELVLRAADCLRSWSEQLARETRLVRVSALRLIVALLVVPALVLGTVAAADALIATLLNRWLHDWSSCLSITLFLNFAALFAVLSAMQHWWRNLTMSRSRGALARLLDTLT